MTEESAGQEGTLVIEDTAVPVKNPEVTVKEEMEVDGKFLKQG